MAGPDDRPIIDDGSGLGGTFPLDFSLRPPSNIDHAKLILMNVQTKAKELVDNHGERLKSKSIALPDLKAFEALLGSQPNSLKDTDDPWNQMSLEERMAAIENISAAYRTLNLAVKAQLEGDPTLKPVFDAIQATQIGLLHSQRDVAAQIEAEKKAHAKEMLLKPVQDPKTVADRLHNMLVSQDDNPAKGIAQTLMQIHATLAGGKNLRLSDGREIPLFPEGKELEAMMNKLPPAERNRMRAMMEGKLPDAARAAMAREAFESMQASDDFKSAVEALTSPYDKQLLDIMREISDEIVAKAKDGTLQKTQYEPGADGAIAAPLVTFASLTKGAKGIG